MLLANLEKLCLQQCCTKRYLLSCQPGLYVCLPGSLSGALVNLEVLIRNVVYDEDRFWWQMRNQFLLVIRSSPSFRFSSVISDKNNKGHHSQT